MGKTKHEKTYVDFDKPYEQNIIGFRGILYFGLGLFLLIVITFGLMWFLLAEMEQRAVESDNAETNPLAFTKEEALPPEPRLQAAPGFGVGTGEERVNLELREPQAEYRVLLKKWEKIWEKGQTVKGPNGETTVVTLSIEDAKKRYLEQQESENAGDSSIYADSKKLVSAPSAGRLSSGTER